MWISWWDKVENIFSLLTIFWSSIQPFIPCLCLHSVSVLVFYYILPLIHTSFNLFLFLIHLTSNMNILFGYFILLQDEAPKGKCQIYLLFWSHPILSLEPKTKIGFYFGMFEHGTVMPCHVSRDMYMMALCFSPVFFLEVFLSIIFNYSIW